jgi:hypothetical protein
VPPLNKKLETTLRRKKKIYYLKIKFLLQEWDAELASVAQRQTHIFHFTFLAIWLRKCTEHVSAFLTYIRKII